MMASRTLATIVLAAAAAAPVDRAAAGSVLDLSPSNIPVSRIISGGPPKDGIPALLSPHFVAPADAAAFMTSSDPVVGITIDAHARAYPIKILNWHEIVNDELGRRPIAVTYCPLTGSAVVFDRRVGDDVLSFGVSGRLYNSNVLMYDHQGDGLWSQLAAASVTGDRLGAELREIPAVVTTWSRWRAAHPDTLVLSTRTGHRRDYQRDPYAGYESSAAPMFPAEPRDARLRAKDRVLGVVVPGAPDDEARAYPFAELARAGGKITDVLAGREIEVELSGPSALARDDRGLLPAVSVYWFAWAAFHPSTTIWRATELGHRGEPDPDSAADAVRVTETRSYWTSLGAVAPSGTADVPAAHTGMFVVAGTIENVAARPVHSVHLAVALIDAAGREVHRQIAYNRAAEALRDLDDGPIREQAEVAAIRPIPAGGTDTYRMIFLGDEIPEFESARVTVLRAHVGTGAAVGR